jgi:hypothetical protein
VIRYEVTLECSESTAPGLERWMRNRHIPDMLSTGCFSAIHFDHGDGRFRTVYQCTTRDHLDQYLTQHAERMRHQFRSEFPDGVAINRDVWQQLQSWTPM